MFFSSHNNIIALALITKRSQGNFKCVFKKNQLKDSIYSKINNNKLNTTNTSNIMSKQVRF